VASPPFAGTIGAHAIRHTARTMVKAINLFIGSLLFLRTYMKNILFPETLTYEEHFARF